MDGDNQHDEPRTEWKYTKGHDASQTERSASITNIKPVAWEASEYVAHEKSAAWYVLLGLGAIVLAIVVFIVTRDVVSTAVIIIAALIFGLVAGRKPRVIQYALDKKGITVGTAFRAYDNFKSFSVFEEDSVAEVVFMPLKRFMPPLNIYVGPKEENEVMQTISTYLPLDQSHGNDVIDRFVRRLRF